MAINPQEHKPEQPSPKTKKTSSFLVAAIVLLLIACAGGAWFFVQNRQATIALHSTTPVKPVADTHPEQPVTHTAEEKVEPLNQEESLSTGKEDINSDAVPEMLNGQQQCEQVTKKLQTFFHHLDSEQYIKEFKLNQPVAVHFTQLTAKLLANPPVVTRESDDLYTILTNMAHFFRIIGRNNILLIKGILDRERDKIEDVAAELYTCTIVNKCTGNTFQMQAPLDKVYEYAGFFLNTMGGRSYLFRRDSRSRLLVNYYALLIVDLANKKNLNRYGLDIRGSIPKLIQEIEATNQLIYKEDYIDNLSELQEKYQNN
jgi:hypothetical protein